MSKLPDYKLKVLNKVNERRGEVGAGWKNKDGSISIQLDLCIILDANSSLVITLFPIDFVEKGVDE